MPRKRKLLNLRERCRLCLTENGEMQNLFTEPYSLKLKDLSDCTSIEIKSEQNLPKNVCHACVYKLEMWNEFKERFTRSNRLLLTRLEATESTDLSAIQPKRKFCDPQESSEGNNLNENKKKPRFNKSPPRASSTIFEDQIPKEVDSNSLPIISPKKIVDFVTSTNVDKDIENDLNFCSKPSISSNYRQSARRGRTTERRKASTRRWVARKKALIAATGNNSDTDSGVSDSQLSPVQKARAKSNAEREEEKQKKIARALKNLETNMNDFKRGSDSEARRTRRSRLSISEKTKNQIQKSVEKIKEKQKIRAKEKKKQETEKENFSIQPQTVKSELRIGDSTYIVTSTLVISEPAHLNKCLTESINHENNENTDIIDAVQLKRVAPAPNITMDKRLLERCLNIEVEGTELEALQRVQVDLASFVERDMKEKLFAENGIFEDLKEKAKGSYDSLDQQLKAIVVKAIKKNYETTLQNKEMKDEDEKSKTVSPEFVKAAMLSAIFQPKLILTKLDISKVQYKINNLELLHMKTDITGCLKKQITPLTYVKGNSFSGDDKYSEIESSEKIIPKKKIKQHVESVECDTTTMSQDLQSTDSFQRLQNENLKISKELNTLNQQKPIITHRCGICGRLFRDRKEAEDHIKLHRESSLKFKEKLMRCKRCHEIVAARYVKLHICSQQYKCRICESSFISEKSLINHMAIHNHGDTHILQNSQRNKCTVCDEQFNSEKQLVEHLSIHDNDKSILKCNVCDIDFSEEKELITHLQSHDKSDFEKPLRSININLQEKKHEINEQVSNIERKGLTTKLEKKTLVEGLNKSNSQKKHEGYTCFVCDKKFNDEEVMKDHLQQHCDDMSEEEQSSKEHFQCAICGESLESEDALGTHVENHLFDDGDDNPNLINITENGKPKEIKLYCDQCPEEFPSNATFAMHKEAHEEQIAISEWEREKNMMHDHSCTICDEVFQNEEDLAEHLDVHNENTHVCLLCEKSFPTLSDLQAHVESH